MPRIETSILVNAEIDRVFALARDIERYPEFMPDIKSVRITERTAERQVSEWVGLVQAGRVSLEMKWTEDDFWDEATHTCRWRQLKGDFQQYDGMWTFTPTETGTQMSLAIDFRYEVPLVGPLIKSLVNRLMKANAEAILAALKEQAEKPAAG
ncbi:MAG: hypothetical protein GX774_16650 [Armatimonadetes bacterium]|jgi:ribosome-associated toxin RatA of RatAB toxin-antitoxin module|nr:hypothetical protein [Armatimonadota bacterium]